MNPSAMIRFSEIPFKIQVENVRSNFVQFFLFLKTSQLTTSQRQLLPLLLDLWMSSPLIKDGVVTDVETIVKRKTKTFLHVDHFLGFSGKITALNIIIIDQEYFFDLTGDTFTPGAYSDSVIIEAQCELSKFGEAVQYLGDVINHPHFTSKMEIISTLLSNKSICSFLKIISQVKKLCKLFGHIFLARHRNM